MSLSIQFEMRIDGAAPTGYASVHGRDPRAFSGRALTCRSSDRGCD